MLNEIKSAGGKILLIVFSCLFSTGILSQNITNTLGSTGLFTIKDAGTNYLTLSQSTGQLNILKTLRLEVTNNSTTGVIFKGADRFIHNYNSGTSFNTFMGINAGNFTLTTANYNTGIGYQSLFGLTTGFDNTALGMQSLLLNSTGAYNTAVGNFSLRSNTTGIQNTALGTNSLQSNNIGAYNTAVGYESLGLNTGGAYNTALGMQSLLLNTTGLLNTAVGYQSLYLNTIGNQNTAVGMQSLRSNTTGIQNTALGMQTLYFNTTGLNNTALGSYSLYNNTGDYNTAVGNNTGSNITTGSNLTCLGYNTQPTTGSATNQITLGNGSITSLRCNVTTITSLSDMRDKKNISELTLGIDFLMKIKPRLFNWDKREWYEGSVSDGTKMQETPTAGFIAQELDEAQTTQNAQWLNLVLKDNPEKWEATPGNLLPIMVKAIQELKSENDELKEKLTKFEEMQNMLVLEIEKLKAKDSDIKEVKLGEK